MQLATGPTFHRRWWLRCIWHSATCPREWHGLALVSVNGWYGSRWSFKILKPEMSNNLTYELSKKWILMNSLSHLAVIWCPFSLQTFRAAKLSPGRRGEMMLISKESPGAWRKLSRARCHWPPFLSEKRQRKRLDALLDSFILFVGKNAWSQLQHETLYKCCCLTIYSAWWLTYPSEKYEFVSWDDLPNI